MASIVDIIINAQDKASSTIKSVGGAFFDLEGKAQKVSGLVIAGFGALGAGVGIIGAVGVQYNAMLESCFCTCSQRVKG